MRDVELLCYACDVSERRGKGVEKGGEGREKEGGGEYDPMMSRHASRSFLLLIVIMSRYLCADNPLSFYSWRCFAPFLSLPVVLGAYM
jgi:hypothetical protein